MVAGTLGLNSPPPRLSRTAVLANWLGIAALIVPVLAFGLSLGSYEACGWSILVFLLTLPLSLVAVVLGFAARFHIRHDPHLAGVEKAGGAYKKGFAGLLLFLVLGLMSPVHKLPPCGERTAKNDASAAGSLRTINTACALYASTYPKQGFPRSLGQLGPPATGGPEGPEHARLIDNVLAAGLKSGYVFTYTQGSQDGKGTILTYTVTARPAEFGKTGYRSFFTDQTGVLRWTVEDRSATAQDPAL